jgi:alkylation response protein AidB-like acyl-CoA dehydrogenase
MVTKALHEGKQADGQAPIFDPAAFGIAAEPAALIVRAQRLAAQKFAARAAAHDRDATFPTENYRDLHEAGLLAICIPRAHGGLGADYRTYALAAAEVARHCGATALTWNMHVCSTLWAGALADDLDMDVPTRAAHEQRRALHFTRIVQDGAIYAQPFSEANPSALGAIPFGTAAKPVAGGWSISGRKVFASLSGHADYYGVLCTETAADGALSRRNTLYLAVPANADGVRVTGDWDPLGMRGTVSRTLEFTDVFVPEDAALMPRGIYFQAASRWPHMFLTLSPTYIGLAQAAYDFTVAYLRGDIPDAPAKRRSSVVKQLAGAEMRIKLEQTKALWFQAISEARVDPTPEQRLRAYAAQFATMEAANDIARLAIRTCGGHSIMRSLPLERIYRDSRCGSLMAPWTAEICLERIGRGALYREGEQD